jgi:hypothetical protein
MDKSISSFCFRFSFSFHHGFLFSMRKRTVVRARVKISCPGDKRFLLSFFAGSWEVLLGCGWLIGGGISSDDLWIGSISQFYLVIFFPLENLPAKESEREGKGTVGSRSM